MTLKQDPEQDIEWGPIGEIVPFLRRHLITIWSYGCLVVGLIGVVTGLLCLLHPGPVAGVKLFGNPVSTPREKLIFAALSLMFAVVGGGVILVRRSRQKGNTLPKR